MTAYRDNPAYQCFLKPPDAGGEYAFNTGPATDEVIAFTEEQLGVRLPKAYVELLQKQNGGYVGPVSAKTIEVPENESGSLLGFESSGDSIAGVSADPSVTNTLLYYRDLKFEWSGDGEPEFDPNWVPFASDGHVWLCFDYNANGPQGEPTIIFVDLEDEYRASESGEDSFAFYTVASSVEDLFNRLVFDFSGNAILISDIEFAEAYPCAVQAGWKLDRQLDDNPNEFLKASYWFTHPRFEPADDWRDSADLVIWKHESHENPAHPLARPGKTQISLNVSSNDQDGCLAELRDAFGESLAIAHWPVTQEPPQSFNG